MNEYTESDIRNAIEDEEEDAKAKVIFHARRVMSALELAEDSIRIMRDEKRLVFRYAVGGWVLSAVLMVLLWVVRKG